MNCVSVAVSGRLQFPDVSEMTLRTDLKVLDEEKKILRVHGGAKSVRVIIGTDDFLNRKSVAILRKKRRLPKKPQSCFIRTQHFSGFRQYAHRFCAKDSGPLLPDIYDGPEPCYRTDKSE